MSRPHVAGMQKNKLSRRQLRLVSHKSQATLLQQFRIWAYLVTEFRTMQQYFSAPGAKPIGLMIRARHSSSAAQGHHDITIITRRAGYTLTRAHPLLGIRPCISLIAQVLPA